MGLEVGRAVALFVIVFAARLETSTCTRACGLVAWECLPLPTQLPLRLWGEGRHFDKLPLPRWNGGKLVGERFRAGLQALGRDLASRRRRAMP